MSDDSFFDKPGSTSSSGLEQTAQAAPRADAPPALVTGDLVGRYRITDVLGAGGMGVVYCAWDESLRRNVALKLIRSHTADPAQLARFTREAQAMARLSHRNVVGVHDFGVHVGQPYLVMELIRGSSLRDWFQRSTRTWREVVAQLLGAAEGLHAAHRAGIVHRDFKPENVLVADDGRVAVSDLGLARSFEHEGLDSAPVGALAGSALQSVLTKANGVMGTPLYMAPEQFKGLPTDARTDVFAFGIVLYEALFGQRPFPASATTQEVTLEILAAEVSLGRFRAPPADRRIPKALHALIRRCLEPSPAARPQSMADVVAMLEGALRRAPSRRPLAFVAIAVVAALGLGALWLRRVSPVSAARATPAQLAFDDAMKLYRAASSEPARRSLTHALELDPGFAAAELWLAFLSTDPSEQRAHFAKAQLDRAALSADDAVLLDALADGQWPLPDLERWDRSIDAAIDAHPSLATLYLLRASVRVRRGQAEAALDDLTKATRLDAGLAAVAAAQAAQVERLRYQRAASVAAYETCLRASARATDCLAARGRLRGAAGDCVGMEQDARDWAAADPLSADASLMIANALQAQGAPWPSVIDSLKSHRSKLDEKARASEGWLDDYLVDVMRGDFVSARRSAQARMNGLPSDAGMLAQYQGATWLVLVLLESGDREAAGSLAAGVLARAPAWTSESVQEASLTLLFVSIAYNAGVIDKAEREAQRTKWLAVVDRARAKVGGVTDPYSKSIAWVVGYAAATKTREQAEEAMAALPAFAPLPPAGLRGTDTDLVIGTVFELAGDAKAARRYLETAAHSCNALENPWAHVYGQLHLGNTLATLGEPAAARVAYQSVLEAWGKAQPHSVSAERAMRALERLDTAH